MAEAEEKIEELKSSSTDINLGFSFPDFSSSEVLRCNVPSKIGGKPAWLNPNKLPTDLKCRKCGACLVFLLQIYAPRVQILDAHRTIYLFACWICGEDVRAYRSILRDDTLLSDQFDSNILSQCCSICLLPADWKATDRGDDPAMDTVRDHQRCLNGQKYGLETSHGMIAESILEIEAEADADCNGNTNNSPCVDDKILLSKLPLMDNEDEDENQDDEDRNRDVCLENYIAYMSKYAGHVIRYGGSEPVWFSDKDQITERDVPTCPKCGSKRSFEFQVQSTLLDAAGYNINANLELAFGILCVYTCANDCFSTDADASPYSDEFVHKQKDKTLSDKRLEK